MDSPYITTCRQQAHALHGIFVRYPQTPENGFVSHWETPSLLDIPFYTRQYKL